MKGITVVPFATSGSSGMGDSSKNLQELAKGANVAEGKRFGSGASADENDNCTLEKAG
ncbi:MAG: hypothetical protein K5668_06990 [Lachnospiraceae bacterium]|nr:hypothetical protein [Lachnospiraceae bacterium]